MSAHCALEVIRAQDVTWQPESRFYGKARNFYVKVKFGDEEKKTHMQDKMPLTWNETLTLSPIDPSKDGEVTVELNHRWSLRRKTCVGSTVMSLQNLLNKSISGEVQLTLFPPSQARSSTGIGILFVRLKPVSAMEKANTDIKTAVADVDQSGIASDGTAARVDAVNEIAAGLDSQKDLAYSLANILDKIDLFVDLIDKLSTIHPYLSAAWQVVSSLYKCVRNQVETDRKFVELVHMMEEIFDVISDAEFIRDKVKSFERTIERFLQQSNECCLFVQHYVRRGFGKRILDVTSSRKIDDFSTRFQGLKQALLTGAAFQATCISARMSDRINTIFLRQELSPSETDASNRKECLPGTRSQLLEEIMDWLFSDSDENILWLHGVAGCGKSTVSMTIAEYCLKQGRRGAYLFFEREKSDPGSVIRTIAFLLASFDPSIAKHVTEAVESHSSIGKASIVTQFDKLLNEPLYAATNAMNGPVVIILDALDECGTSVSRGTLLSLLRKEAPKLPRNFRFLVTSRPEADISEALSSPSIREIELDYSSQSSRDDVSRYLDHEMRILFKKKDLPSDWDQNVALLARTANGLFVWASTAVKLISTSTYRIEELEDLLSYCRSDSRTSQLNEESDLSDLYDNVLRRSGIRWTDNRSKPRFVQVLGLILLSKGPLSVTTIDGILGFTEKSSSRHITDGLRSVLEYTPENPDAVVRLFHASFADYLTSPERVNDPWYIDVSSQRDFIAVRCFDVMGNNLRFNICNLESSFLRNSDVIDIEKRVKDNITLHLEYACRFWAEHLLDVPYSSASQELPKKLENFAKRHLLYWFEVLSLAKHFRRLAGRALLDAVIWSASNMSEISSFLWYTYRLASAFSLPISESVPHIYLSALSFAVEESKIANEYAKAHPVIQVQTFGTKPRQSCLKTFTGHTGGVNSVAFSPDGKRIVSDSHDKTIRVWDAETGEVVSGPFTGHTDRVCCVAFSPDGKRIASGSRDKTIRVWDAETGEAVSDPFTGHTDSVWSVAFSPDGKRIASGSSDNTIRVWDAETDEAVSSLFMGHTFSVWSVAFAPDGKRIASGSYDKTIRVWDAETGEVVSDPFTGHTGSVYSVAFSPDGKRIVSGSDDETIRVWDAETGEAVSDPFTGHTGSVCSVAFSPDGKRIVSSSDDTIRVWDAETGEVVSGPFTGHTEVVCSVVFSPDGKRIVSGSRDKTIRVWDAETGEVVSDPFTGHTNFVLSVAFSPDGKRIASGSADSTIRVWDAETGEVVSGPFTGHTDYVCSVAFSPDGKRIVSGSGDKTIRVWDAESGEVVSDPFTGHINDVRSVAFSPDGKRIASGSNDETIRVWDVETGEAVSGPFRGHTEVVCSVAFSPDGKRIVSSSDDKTIRVWDAETGEVVSDPFTGHTEYVLSVAFSPDGKRIASGSYDKTIRVWDAETGEVVSDPFTGHTDYVCSVAFSPDGKRIVSGSRDKTIRVWDAETGEVVSDPFTGHTDWVCSVAFSPDGKRIVSGSRDNTIRVWDAKTGETVSDPQMQHTGWVDLGALSPDRRRKASVSFEGTIRVYDVEDRRHQQTTLIEQSVRTSSSASAVNNAGRAPSLLHVGPSEGRTTASILRGVGVGASWTISKDGWLLGKKGELLMWIPPDVFYETRLYGL